MHIKYVRGFEEKSWLIHVKLSIKIFFVLASMKPISLVQSELVIDHFLFNVCFWRWSSFTIYPQICPIMFCKSSLSSGLWWSFQREVYRLQIFWFQMTLIFMACQSCKSETIWGKPESKCFKKRQLLLMLRLVFYFQI